MVHWFRIYLLAGDGFSSAQDPSNCTELELSVVTKHLSQLWSYLVLRVSLQSSGYYYLCLPQMRKWGSEWLNNLPQGQTVMTDPGFEPDVIWMPSFLFFLLCPFSIVCSFIPSLFIESLPDNDLGPRSPAAMKWFPPWGRKAMNRQYWKVVIALQRI